MAFGDVENDGNEDIFEKMGGAYPGDIYQSVLYRNPGNGNHWITLELEGVKSNRAAFGALRIAKQAIHPVLESAEFSEGIPTCNHRHKASCMVEVSCPNIRQKNHKM